LGHDAQLISAKLVDTVRQNQKNYKNDALAIVQASQLPDIKFIAGKSRTQQQMQSIMRLRELSIKQKTAQQNQLTALLLEFNIRVSNKNGGLRGTVESALEDAENGLTDEFRKAIHQAWLQYIEVVKSVSVYDICLEKAIKDIPECQKLMDLEGIGVINAVNLYNVLFCSDNGTFKKGKDASACIGLTPVQHSSGGKTKLGSIGKHIRNSTLRSQLVTGAFTYVNHVNRRSPKTKKEVWLKALIERRGKKCAAVALANKTVRTAFAILSNNTYYRAEPI
jgi:transposase